MGKPVQRLFGTDGIRGKANSFPMNVEIAQKLGQAVGCYFRRRTGRHHVLVGKDTRLSGYMLESALASGFLSAGMDVTLLGPLPTPAVSALTRSLRADLGVMISASHNPYQDNGLKLFGPDGYKLSDGEESQLEKLMGSDLSRNLAEPDEVGKAFRLADAVGRYIEIAKSSFPRGLRLDGIRIVVDAANGAAYHAAPTALWELGAEVIKIGCAPNGRNINLGCGSTAPKALQQAVVEHKAYCGIALDGDADRLLMVDEHGRLIDGDHLLAYLARFYQEQSALSAPQVVGTQMANLGLEKYISGLGLDFTRTPVGDRYVLERMRADGANLGGEQSGHILVGDYIRTGDGLVAALQVLSGLVSSGQKASHLADLFASYPQILLNVPYSGTSPLTSRNGKKLEKEAAHRLKGKGRVLLRNSGTEPLVRIMVEAESESLAKKTAEEIRRLLFS